MVSKTSGQHQNPLQLLPSHFKTPLSFTIIQLNSTPPSSPFSFSSSVMISDKMTASAVGGKTARACDCCVRRRARWYCAADDAFLCQACDGSVHAANPLARRHERVRLKTASSDEPCIPSWNRGFNKKPRTPRHGKKQMKLDHHHHHQIQFPLVVPELDHDQFDEREEDQQNLYRVPVFDPFDSELCSISTATSNELVLPGDDLAEFAAEVETLLGKGLDGEMCGIEELGLFDWQERDDDALVVNKVEEIITDVKVKEDDHENVSKDWRMSLRLDYDAISMVWSSRGSPWLDGERPMINPNDSWLNTTIGGFGAIQALGQGPSSDGGREARVSRYREKRRTRLFSKKIRYEVRKLNAEKRPRMKGRFVKRSTLS